MICGEERSQMLLCQFFLSFLRFFIIGVFKVAPILLTFIIFHFYDLKCASLFAFLKVDFSVYNILANVYSA